MCIYWLVAQMVVEIKWLAFFFTVLLVQIEHWFVQSLKLPQILYNHKPTQCMFNDIVSWKHSRIEITPDTSIQSEVFTLLVVFHGWCIITHPTFFHIEFHLHLWFDLIWQRSLYINKTSFEPPKSEGRKSPHNATTIRGSAKFVPAAGFPISRTQSWP